MSDRQELRVQVEGASGMEASDTDEAARLLAQELQQLDIRSIRSASDGPPPSGSKGVDVAALGQLLVDVGPALPVVVATVRAWVERSPVGRVRLRFGEDEVVIDGATPEQQDRALDAFIARHGAGPQPG